MNQIGILWVIQMFIYRTGIFLEILILAGSRAILRIIWTTLNSKNIGSFVSGKCPRNSSFKKDDPDMIHNLADYSEYSAIKLELQEKLEMYLQETDDSRAKGKSPWDTYNLDK